MVIIKKISVKDLINNKELLNKMYLIVLKGYYELEEKDFPINNYIKCISSNNMQKEIFYLEEKEIISYLECELIKDNSYYVSLVTTSILYRNKGYARTLLKEVISYLQTKEASDILIHVNKDKMWLRNFYERIGFVQISNDNNLEEVSYKYIFNNN